MVDSVTAKIEEDLEHVPLCCSIRLLMYLMANVACAFVVSNFSSFHFAWVCMTVDIKAQDNNQTEIHGSQSHNNTLESDKKLQSILFMGYPIGGLMFVILSGWLMDKLGARILCFAIILLTTLSTLLIPYAAFYSWPLVFILRIFVGTSGAVGWPLAYNVASHWAPKKELGLCMSIVLCGFQLGSFFSMWSAGFQCKYWGWKYIFYTLAAFGFIFSIIWLIVFRTEPSNHPWISESEKKYVMLHRSKQYRQGHKHVTPWKELFASSAVWATTITCICSRSCTNLVNMFMPTFYQDVLVLDITDNGLYSSIPYLTQLIGRCIAGPLSDSHLCNTKCCANKTNSIKGFNTIALLSSTFATTLMALTIKMDAEPALPVFLLCVVMFGGGFCTGGFMKSPVLIAPHNTGVIGSINYAAGCLAGVILPMIVTGIVTTGSVNEWRTLFIIASFMSLIGAVVFLLIGSGELQPWDKNDDDDQSSPGQYTPGRKKDDDEPDSISVGSVY